MQEGSAVTGVRVLMASLPGVHPEIKELKLLVVPRMNSIVRTECIHERSTCTLFSLLF